MATRVLTRSLLSSLTRSYSSPIPFSLRRLRSLVSVAANVSPATTAAGSLRGFATRPTSSSLNDPNPNWSNRPPKETILLDGCDFEHWLVVMEKPEGDPVRDEIIDSYIKTLASVVGSEEEARMKIYSVSTRHYYAFGALVSEELSYKLKELPRVRWVLPDSYLDVKNKDYGGEPFINGQAVPYDPKYHEEWVRNNARANERNRRNDRPRNNDRSRNFERRRDMGNQNAYNAGPNMTGGVPSNTGGMQHPNMGGPPNMGVPSNTGGMQHPNMGGPPNMGVSPNPVGMQHSNMGGPPNQGVMQPSNMGVMQQQPNMPPNMRGMQQPNSGRMQPNMGGVLPNTAGGPSHSYRGAPNSAPNFQNNGGPNRGMPYQSGPGPNQNYAPNMPGGNPYQNQGFNQNYAPNTTGGDPNQNQGPNQNYSPNTTGGDPNQNQGPNQNYPPSMSGGNHYQNQNMPPPNYE